MPVPRIDELKRVRRTTGPGTRLWAEWCFVRVCWRHFRLRLAIMLVVLIGGALMFRGLEPEKQHGLLKSMHMTFLLVWGEPPEDFPSALPLQLLFFIIPIVGLTVIIEGIVDFALILRDRRRFEHSWCSMLAASMRDHVVLVGLGRLGYHTFLTLRRLGEPVVVIERDPNNQFLEDVRRDGSPLLIGDARREALLGDAGVVRARSIVLATDDDLANLECAMDARKINTSIRVVLRMFDQNMADKVRDGFAIELAMSQSAISAPTFASCAVSPATVNSIIVEGELLSMQRWLVRTGGPMDGMTVGQVLAEHRVMVLHKTSPDAPTLMMPPHDVSLGPGDGLMLQGRVPDLERVRALQMSSAAAG